MRLLRNAEAREAELRSKLGEAQKLAAEHQGERSAIEAPETPRDVRLKLFLEAEQDKTVAALKQTIKENHATMERIRKMLQDERAVAHNKSIEFEKLKTKAKEFNLLLLAKNQRLDAQRAQMQADTELHERQRRQLVAEAVALTERRDEAVAQLQPALAAQRKAEQRLETETMMVQQLHLALEEVQSQLQREREAGGAAQAEITALKSMLEATEAKLAAEQRETALLQSLLKTAKAEQEMRRRAYFREPAEPADEGGLEAEQHAHEETQRARTAAASTTGQGLDTV